MGTLQSIGYIANMEKLTKQDLLVISAYTGYCIGVSFDETLKFIEDLLECKVTKESLIDRKVTATYRGKIAYMYKVTCRKLERMAE